MKGIVFFAFSALALFACKKENNSTYKVKYSVSGTEVNQFKISFDATDNFVSTPFSATKDTVVYQPAGTMLKLDAKAGSGSNLIGAIYVNDALVATQTDADG